MSKYTELKEKYKGKRIILHVASYLSPMKGTEYAIEAMGYVNKEFPDALLLIMTSDKDNTRRMLELQSLSVWKKANIDWVINAPDEDMPAYYSIAECLLAPSLDENVHLPQLEAQACGTPVVAIGSVNSSEELIENVTGMLAEKDNIVNSLYVQIHTMWQYEQYNKKIMGKKAREFILENFSWGKCMESYKRIISEVINAQMPNL